MSYKASDSGYKQVLPSIKLKTLVYGKLGKIICQRTFSEKQMTDHDEDFLAPAAE